MGPSQCGCACAHTASATSLGRRFLDHTITWRVRDIHPLHVGWLVYRSRPQQGGSGGQQPSFRPPECGTHPASEERALSSNLLARPLPTYLLVGTYISYTHICFACARASDTSHDGLTNGATVQPTEVTLA